MKITEDMSRQAYSLARGVYQSRLTRRNAVATLVSRGMNSASAADLINNLRHMLNGEIYHRTLNFFTTKMYLEQIRSEFGQQKYRNALNALRQHLDYYDGLRMGRQVKLRNLLDELSRESSADIFYPDEIPENDSLIEGAKRSITVNAYERSVEARRKCIEIYGYACSVCGMNFESVYGDIGEGYIHVHHLKELSSVDGEYVVEPAKDLRPVCPNCHAMLHRRQPAFSIVELQDRLKECK